MTWPINEGAWEPGDIALESGLLANARMTWKTYGTLSEARDNVIVYPTSFAAHIGDIEWLIDPAGVLDPTRWFIVAIDMFGNGRSSSPSNNQAYPALVTAGDNVRAQRRFLAEYFGISRIACVYGWSMGAQQAYHWAALFPDQVEKIIVNCGSARTSPHNQVFLAGLLATLEAAPQYKGRGRFSEEPEAAKAAFGRIYAGWAMSQAFYRERLHLSAFGAPDLESFLRQNWDGRFGHRHAADLHAHLLTWHGADISNNELYGGDIIAALRGIRAQVLLMPGGTDLYFRVADNEIEARHLRHVRLLPIPSDWGHLAGNPRQNPKDARFLRDVVGDWLAA